MLIPIQCSGVQPFLPDVGEQQREVVSILQAGVHSLAANRGVHVPGIASEKDRSLAECRGDAVVHPVAGEPLHPLVGQPEVITGRRKSLLLADVVSRGQGHQPGVTSGAERKGDGERGVAEPGGHRVVRQPPHATKVRNPEGGVVGHALERNIQLAAHGRPRPVGADAPACPNADQSCGSVEQRDDPGMGLVGVISQVDQPVPPEHCGTRRSQ